MDRWYMGNYEDELVQQQSLKTAQWRELVHKTLEKSK
jgi:hypothetical protein